MNFIPSRIRNLVIAAVVITCFGGASLYVQQQYIHKSNTINSLNSGLETCFNRVAQTFTAIMIQQSNSHFLGSDFMGMSSDCFSELSKVASGVSFVSADLNKLVSDTHWFHEKIKKSQDMILNLDQTLNSNIDEKFLSLEELKDSVQEAILNLNQQTLSLIDTWKVVTTLIFCCFAGLVIFGLSMAKKSRQKVTEVESMAETILEQNKISTSQFDGLVEMALTEVSMPNTLSVVKKYVGDQLTLPIEKIDESFEPPSLNTIKEIANLNTVFDIALQSVQNKTFKHGVILDFDLQDELVTFGDQEDLSMVINSLLNFAVDSSLKHNSERKIVVRSEVDEQIINLNMTIQNYMFSASELELLISHKSSLELDTNIIVFKEVIDMLGLKVEIKNNLSESNTSAQVFITFDRAQTSADAEVETLKPFSADQLELKFDYVKKTPAPKQVSVMKGSKKDILKKLSQLKQKEL